MIPQQRPEDLTLIVMHTTQCPLDLYVLQARRVPVFGGVIEFRIIGESHWITVRHGQQVLHEVLACVPVTVPDAVVTHAFIPGAPCSHAEHGYAVMVACAPLTPAIAAWGRGSDSIEVVFPHPHGGDVLPFTRIWWQAEPFAIRWWTLHVYPGTHETLAVVSEGQYAWAERARCTQQPVHTFQNNTTLQHRKE